MERCQAGAEYLLELGVRNAEFFKDKANDAIRLAVSMLPTDEVQRIVTLVPRCMPFTLTCTGNAPGSGGVVSCGAWHAVAPDRRLPVVRP